MVKSGPVISVTTILRVTDPGPVPVMVIGKTPGGVVPAVVLMDIVDDPEPVSEVGAKVAFAPAGKPDAPNVTNPLKLLRALTVVLPLTLWPGITLSVGVADVSRKSAAVLSVTLSKVAC